MLTVCSSSAFSPLRSSKDLFLVSGTRKVKAAPKPFKTPKQIKVFLNPMPG
ncbi:hypothetical protein Mapa_011234 [Marchantia paleacea]|nr:hypothetical protein Mapa_011234 [Marchantia paleacea]